MHMMSLSFKIILAFGFFLNQLLITCLSAGDRVYTISFTTGTNRNDGTRYPVYFKIYGVNGDSTEWFKYDSFPSLGTKYEFNRCLNDVGSIESIDMVRKSEDHSTPARVSVDNLSYTYTYKYAYVACRRMNVNFIKQQFTQYNDGSYCRNINDNIIDDSENCVTGIDCDNAAKSLSNIKTNKFYEFYMGLESKNIYNHFYTTVENPSMNSNYKATDNIYEGYVWYHETVGITVPLYRQYSKIDKNHYYTTSNQLWDNDYSVAGISGYVMTESCPGLNQPLYQYWSKTKHDHLYNANYYTLGKGNGDYELVTDNNGEPVVIYVAI